MFQVSKGSSFQIGKGILSVLIGCGWNPSATSGEEFDLDAHAFALTSADKFYGFPKTPLALTYANIELPRAPELNAKAFKTAGGEMVHLGDNRTGAGDGDDETMQVALDKMPAEVQSVAIYVTIHEAAKRNQTFARVSGAYVRVLDASTKEVLCKYDLAETFGAEISLHVASLVRTAEGWSFTAVGQGSTNDLGQILATHSA